MPVYTYRCTNCDVQFEHTQKFSDSSLEVCPECGKKTLRKVYLPVGIVFKGSGFYATDHRSPSGAPRGTGSAESKSSSESASSGEEKSSKEERASKDEKSAKEERASAEEKSSGNGKAVDKVPAARPSSEGSPAKSD